MAANSKQLKPLQIVEAIPSCPHLSHQPPSDNPAREEAEYQASFSADRSDPHHDYSHDKNDC
ncbi:MAG: hypothetical protein AAB466_14345 [Verrucomicrobiota bacterium]